MKKSALVLGLGLAIIGLSAFSTKTTSDNPKHASTIKWIGSKVVGGDHTGNISIREEQLKFKKGALVGGSITADMTTITNTDLEGEWNQKLVGHLNSDDFFSTAKFPTATISITKVTPGSNANTYQVTADLTIKGITHSQSFLATVSPDGKQHIVTAKLNIDRTKYEVKYGSTSFFDSLGDKAISDEFSLDVTIYTAH